MLIDAPASAGRLDRQLDAALPGRAAGGAFKILVDGKDMTDLGRAPSASTCYYNIHIPNYATREILEDKLREAIVKPEGFDLE